MKKESCKSCRFYYKQSLEHGNRYLCRRHPPQFCSNEGHQDRPQVSEDDWCGEYKRKGKQ